MSWHHINGNDVICNCKVAIPPQSDTPSELLARSVEGMDVNTGASTVEGKVESKVESKVEENTDTSNDTNPGFEAFSHTKIYTLDMDICATDLPTCATDSPTCADTQQLEQLKTENRDLANCIREYALKVSSLNDEKSAILDCNAALKCENAELESLNGSMGVKIVELSNSEASDDMAELIQVSEMYDELRTVFDKTNIKNTELESKNTELESKNKCIANTLSLQRENVNKSVKEYLTLNADLTNERDILKSHLSKRNSHIDELECERDNILGTNAHLYKRISDLEEENAYTRKLNQSLSAGNGVIHELKAQNSALEKRNGALEEEIALFIKYKYQELPNHITYNAHDTTYDKIYKKYRL
tara:strand:+ start:20642 stop:21721 length:1080 start_codon:yes stop_codon:yes gene_type:complete